MINKAELIREALASTDWDRDKIASVIGCRVEYVRVVEQRLLAGGETPSSKNWRANNPDKVKRLRMEWREANPERAREIARRSTKKWRENNLERARAINRAAYYKRRARQLAEAA